MVQEDAVTSQLRRPAASMVQGSGNGPSLDQGTWPKRAKQRQQSDIILIAFPIVAVGVV